MWWGDLVTMAWWDDLWLNESFATFIGYKVIADLMPEWGMWRDFVATLVRPFNLDALVSTHPISFEVKNAKQATERFDVITYWKGAGVVRMIEGFLGAEAFRTGVRTYLNRYRERNATADDFWRELGTASGRDVGDHRQCLDHRARPSGARTSTARDGQLDVRQQRFFADPDAPPDAANGAVADAAGDQVRQRRRHSRSPRARRPSRADDRAPRRRVVLPQRRRRRASSASRSTMPPCTRLVGVVQSALNPAERLTLVGNQWALVRACKADIGQFFTMLAGFRSESRPRRAVGDHASASTGCRRTSSTTPAGRPSSASSPRFMRPHFDALGWDPRRGESADDRLRRATVIGALGELAGDPAIIDEANARLARYLAEPVSLDANLASAVVGIAARRGDAALYQRYLDRKRAAANDPEEEQRFLFGLTAFEDPELVDRSLAMTLTDEVRPQDRAHLYARLLGTPRRARGGVAVRPPALGRARRAARPDAAAEHRPRPRAS